MPAFNRVTLVGNLTRDPQTRTLDGHNDQSLRVTDFGLAVSRKYRTSGGEEREEVLFIDCAAFGRNAEILGEFARKGRLMLVEGRLKLETWEDKTGGRRSKISVVVETFQFLGSRDADQAEQRGESSGIGPQQTLTKAFRAKAQERERQSLPGETVRTRQPERPARRKATATVNVNTDDIPF